VFDPQEEKNKARSIIEMNIAEESGNVKQHRVERAIGFALDEIKEFELAMADFQNRVGHLHVFNCLISQQLQKQTRSIVEQSRYLIEKTYNKQELEQMPDQVYNQIAETQKKRADLLKKIASSYFAD
jgi:hypothetical protein